MLSCVSFWFEDRIGVHPPAWNLLAFGRYPLSIYSGFIQFFLSWIIPFGFATFYPSVRLLHRGGYLGYAPLVPVVTAVFLGLAILLWNFGVRHYSSTGSSLGFPRCHPESAAGGRGTCFSFESQAASDRA